jgi:hypothetical protein
MKMTLVLFKDFSIANFKLTAFPSSHTLEFRSEQDGSRAETPDTTTALSKANRGIPFQLSHLPHPPDIMTVHLMHTHSVVVPPD